MPAQAIRPATLLSSLIIGCAAMAQPTLTAGQYTCVPGDVFTFRSSGAVSPGPSGPAQTWSYSSLVLNPPEDQLYVEPGTSSGAIHFPTATVLYEATGSGGGTFYSASDNEVLDLGYFASIGGDVVGLCTDPRTMITYPFTYESTFTDGYVCSETGGSFSDRVRTGTTTVTADGYGTLVLPYGTYTDCLRLHIVSSYTDVYEQTSVNGYGTIETYAFVQPGIRVPLLSTGSSSYVQGDQTFGGAVSNLLDPLSTALLAARSGANSLFVHPNPTDRTAYVTAPDQHGTMDLIDNIGRTVRRVPLAKGSLLTLDLADVPPGTYSLRWVGVDGTRSTSTLVRL